MSLQGKRAAALVCLILEQIQDAGLHFAYLEHDRITDFMMFITVKTTHNKPPLMLENLGRCV